MPIFGGASEKCTSCSKTVYATEKIVVDDKEDKKTYHKACLKCTHCAKQLSLGNYASMGGVYYCKPHFKQLFATKGNYDEGFGKEQHKKQWATPGAVVPGTFVPVESTDTKGEKKESSPSVTARFKKTPSTGSVSPGSFVPVETTDTKAEKKETPAGIASRFKATTPTSPGSFVPVETTDTKPEKKETPAAIASRFKTTTPATSGFVPVEKTADTAAVKKETPAGIASRFKSNLEKCTACTKTVYATERIAVEDKDQSKVFHKACLKCTHCSKQLSLGNYASMGGVFYCKPHFKQLFATKGNYDEGFGKEQHKKKWITSDDSASTSTTTTTTTSSSSYEDSEPHHEREAEPKHEEIQHTPEVEHRHEEVEDKHEESEPEHKHEESEHKHEEPTHDHEEHNHSHDHDHEHEHEHESRTSDKSEEETHTSHHEEEEQTQGADAVEETDE